MSNIRLLLVDDYEIVRAGIRSLLDNHPDMEVIGEAANGEEAIALATRYEPDVVLMDVSMPDMDGVEATQRIKEIKPEVNVLALTIQDAEGRRWWLHSQTSFTPDFIDSDSRRGQGGSLPAPNSGRHYGSGLSAPFASGGRTYCL